MKFRSICLVLLALLLMASLANADNFTLGSSYQWVSINGLWVVSPIGGSTLNGASVGDVVCISPGLVSYLGTSWLVAVSGGSSLTFLQKEEAVLFMDAELTASFQDQFDQNVLAAARWDLVVPGSGATLTGLPPGADANILAWVPTVVDDYSYSTVRVFTATGSGVGNQAFLNGLPTLIPPPPQTPEPSTWSMLLGASLLVVGAMRFRKNRNAA